MNLTRFLSFTKYTLLVAVVFFTAFFISSCDNGDNGPAVFNGTTLQLISDARYKQSATVTSDLALDSLVKYLTIYPELTAVLSGTNHTLFAPSNDAFISLIATPNFPADIKQINPEIIKGVLSYHIVAEKKLKKDLIGGAVLTSLFTDPLSPAAAQTITVNLDGTLKTGSSDQAIQIKKADILATNGVVHITNKVLIPPSTGAVLTPILGTIAGTVLLGKDFSNLAKIISAADAGFTENAGTGTFKISTWLAMPLSTPSAVTANAKGFTFFAPPNAVPGAAVLSEATANAIIAGPDKGRAFLLNHLVTSGQYTVADAPASNPNGITKFSTGVITPKSGKTITVSVGTATATNPYGVAITNANPPDPSTFRPIVSKDIAHSNGTIQVFAGVLQ